MSQAGTEWESRAGYDIKRLDAETCEHYLRWLHGNSQDSPPDDAAEYKWALAHCDAGITWGRYDTGVGCWCLGSEAAQDVSPPINRESLQELRIFGERREVLIWRAGTGLCGRTVRETEPKTDRDDENNPLRPSDECRILRGSRVHKDLPGSKFTHIIDGAGAQQVVPESVTSEDFGTRDKPRRPLRLHISHYYERDLETGTVRIAVTRLVKLVKSGQQGGR